jgi:ribose transport system permease protein
MSEVKGGQEPSAAGIKDGAATRPTAATVSPVTAAGLGSPAGRRLVRRLATSTPVYMTGVLIVLIIVFSIVKPDAFPTTTNASNILSYATTFLVMGTGITYVMIAGGIDLSIGSVLVFSNVCAAKAMGALGTNNVLTVVAGVAVALASGLAWGLFNGFCITRLRVPALITTLGTLGAVLGIADLIVSGNDIRTVPPVLLNVETGSFLGLNWLIWVSFVVVVIGGLVLGLTRFGRHVYVIGSNTEAARRGGINVNRNLMKLYALSGLLAGLAGMMSLTQFATTTIAGHSTDFLIVITGVVLGGISMFGGIGSITGAVIGIFISAVLINGFIIMNVQPFWQQVVIGLFLIAAVYLDQLRRRNRDRA